MPQFEVRVRYEGEAVYWVEAPSPAEAEEQGEQWYKNGQSGIDISAWERPVGVTAVEIATPGAT